MPTDTDHPNVDTLTDIELTALAEQLRRDLRAARAARKELRRDVDALPATRTRIRQLRRDIDTPTSPELRQAQEHLTHLTDTILDRARKTDRIRWTLERFDVDGTPSPRSLPLRADLAADAALRADRHDALWAAGIPLPLPPTPLPAP